MKLKTTSKVLETHYSRKLKPNFSSENPKAQVEYINPNEAKIHVTVDEEEQKKLINLNSEDRAASQLTVKYNVAPQSPNGDVLVRHYFTLQKLLTFLIRSGG